MKLFFLLVSLTALAETTAPQPQIFTFNSQKPVCSLIGNKLVLSHIWPFGSWEDCAYSLLSTTIQIDAQRAQALKEIERLNTTKK